MIIQGPCPFCGKLMKALTSDEDDNPRVEHEKPACKTFDDAEDALDFIVKVNNKRLGRLPS